MAEEDDPCAEEESDVDCDGIVDCDGDDAIKSDRRTPSPAMTSVAL